MRKIQAILICVSLVLLLAFVFLLDENWKTVTSIDAHTGQKKTETTLFGKITSVEYDQQDLIDQLEKAGITPPPPRWLPVTTSSLIARQNRKHYSSDVISTPFRAFQIGEMLQNGFFIIDHDAKRIFLQTLMEHLLANEKIDRAIDDDNHIIILSNGKPIGRFPLSR